MKKLAVFTLALALGAATVPAFAEADKADNKVADKKLVKMTDDQLDKVTLATIFAWFAPTLMCRLRS